MDPSDPPKQPSIGRFIPTKREAPPPARELSGRGSVWSPRERKIIVPVFRSSELRYLPKNVQDAVELARIEADREFRGATSDPAAISDRKERELLGKWVLRIVLGFTLAGSEEIYQGRSLAQVVHWRDELFDALCERIEVFSREVQDELRRSTEWNEGERLLEHAAKVATEHESNEFATGVSPDRVASSVEASPEQPPQPATATKKSGRPPALIEVNGAEYREMRGERSQPELSSFFIRHRKKVSVDVIQQAETENLATPKTIAAYQFLKNHNPETCTLCIAKQQRKIPTGENREN